MEEALRTLLAADAGVAGAVGTLVFWVEAPQSVNADFINLHLVSGVPDIAMQGPTGLVESRVQVDCWAATYSAAKTIGRAVKAAVNGYRGDIGSISIRLIRIAGERDDTSPPTGDGHTRYRNSIDLLIAHRST